MTADAILITYDPMAIISSEVPQVIYIPSGQFIETQIDNLLSFHTDSLRVYFENSSIMTVDPVPHLKVAIVGGGPGGLATAIALSKIPSVEVTVYEQASLLREVGAGISIGTNTWNVLTLLGVADTLTSGHETWTILNM